MHILSRKMLAAVRLPGFISEYLRFYAVALALAALVAVYFFIRRLPGWFRSMRASSWPGAQGTVERVNVNVVSGQALGELAYSYVAEGERYSGYCLLQFANEQDAWDTIDPLKAQSILVRYKLSNPALSAVRSADQSFFLANKHGNLMTRLLTRHLLEIMGLVSLEGIGNQVRSKKLASHKRARRIWNGNTAQGCCDLVRVSQLHSGGKLLLLCRRPILFQPNRTVIFSRNLGAEIRRKPQRQGCIRSLQPEFVRHIGPS